MTKNLSIPALRVTILCHIRFRASHKLKWLTFDPRFSEDRIAPNVKDIVVEELNRYFTHNIYQVPMIDFNNLLERR